MAFKPTIPKPVMKMIVFKEANSSDEKAKISATLTEMVLKGNEIVNLNSFYDFIQKRHVTYISYYE